MKTSFKTLTLKVAGLITFTILSAGAMAQNVKVSEEINAVTASQDNGASTNASTPSGISAPSVMNLKTYPNPSSGLFRISFVANDRSDLLIRLTDAAGRELARDTQDNFSGTYSKIYDISKEPEGIYLLTISSNGSNVIAKRIVKNID